MRVDRQSISFVFPMFNEAGNIARTVRRASKLAKELTDDYEIIVVDDASTDDSASVITEIAAKDSRVRPVLLKKNTRFGGALKEGLGRAAKDVVIYTDSDFPAKEDDIKRALEMLDGSDIVTAYSLVVKDATFKRIIMSRVYNWLVQSLFGLSLKDINSGLKIYRRKCLDALKLVSMSPFVDVEIFAECSRRGYRICQYGLIFDLRTAGSSSISRAGVVARTFFDMLKYRCLRR
jgi:glycosyltransferase involved in cell wall biosynthesis